MGISNSTIRIVGRNVSNVTVLDMSTNTKNKIFANTWYNVLAGWDLSGSSNTNCVIYLNGINSTNLISRATGETNVNYLGANTYLGGTPEGNNMFIGCLSEFWFANSYANVTNSAIRSYFVGNTEALLPVNLGISGNTGIGILPIVYLSNTTVNANINSGVGGNFTFANNITTCQTSPSDI